MVTPAKAITKLKAFARTRSGAGVVRKLATLWGILALGAGVTIPAFATPHISSYTFHTTFTLVSPAAWGLMFIGLGVAVLVTLYSRADFAPYPLFLLGITISIMALTTTATIIPDSTPANNGAPLVTWVLIILAVAIFIVGSAVDLPEKDRQRHGS